MRMKLLLLSVFTLIGVLMFSSMVSAVWVTGTSLNLTLPYNNSVLKGTVVLNVTAAGDTNQYDAITLVNISFWNFTGGWVYSTTLRNLTANHSVHADPFNITWTNSSFDTTLLPSGFYNITVNSTNITGSIFGNGTMMITNVTIDNNGPNVSNLLFGNFTNGVNLSNGLAAITGNLVIHNITVFANDSYKSTSVVLFNLTNSSGQVQLLNATRNTTYWNVSTQTSLLNLSALAEGTYTLVVVANDTLNNRNITETFMFTIDRTVPSASVSCTSNPKSGEIVACTCSGSDSGSGLLGPAVFVGDSDGSESTTAGSVGSYTSSVCRVTDYAGNTVATATGSWTVIASTTSSSGTLGTAGGKSVSSKQSEKKVWTSLTKGDAVTVDIKNAEEVGVSSLAFTVGQTVYGNWMLVEKALTLPKDVSALEKKVYKYIKITDNNVQKAIEGNAVVKFKVTQDWLKENILTKENVALSRYTNGQWTSLVTSIIDEDGSFVTYSAETPGFSYFAISEGTSTVAPVAEKKESGVKEGVEKESTTSANGKVAESATSSESSTSTSKATSESQGQTQVMGSSSSTVMWVGVVVALIVIIGLVYWFMSRGKKVAEPKKK